jgi:hypothetical protein
MTSPKTSDHAVALTRASKFTMLLSRDEREQLYELAMDDGVPASVYLRTLIRNVHRTREADKTGKASPKSKAKR